MEVKQPWIEAEHKEKEKKKERKKKVDKTALFDCMIIKLRQFSSGEECDKRWR